MRYWEAEGVEQRTGRVQGMSHSRDRSWAPIQEDPDEAVPPGQHGTPSFYRERRDGRIRFFPIQRINKVICNCSPWQPRKVHACHIQCFASTLLVPDVHHKFQWEHSLACCWNGRANLREWDLISARHVPLQCIGIRVSTAPLCPLHFLCIRKPLGGWH